MKCTDGNTEKLFSQCSFKSLCGFALTFKVCMHTWWIPVKVGVPAELRVVEGYKDCLPSLRQEGVGQLPTSYD